MSTVRKEKDNEKKRAKSLQTIALLLGIVFLLYFVGIALFTGPGSNFYFVWLLMGVVLVAFYIFSRLGVLEAFPLWSKRLMSVLVVLGMLCFLFVQGLIISGFNEKGKDDLDYIIVLGAQLKTSGPSRVLRMRLDEAYRYLEDNSDTKVIVSGGQGSNEPDTEARGMFDYLVNLGVDPKRIIQEDRSTSTVENITFSSRYVDVENDTVGIVTNNFHVFRAVKLAEKAGFENVCGISAPSYPFLQPNNMLREFFGIVKDFVFGNM